MIKIIKKIVWALLRLVGIAGSTQLAILSPMRENGWYKSYYTKESVDANGKPIPWWTYPATRFIEQKLNSNLSVFEFGSGNSTIWMAGKVKSIIALEHNKEWAEKVKTTLPTNAELIFEADNYAANILQSNQLFDVVIVDGIDRNECAINAVQKLSEQGIIIFDDTQRTQDYKKSFDFLKEQGFKQLFFSGLAPITSEYTQTSIFYRQNNCFNI